MYIASKRHIISHSLEKCKKLPALNRAGVDIMQVQVMLQYAYCNVNGQFDLLLKSRHVGIS